MKTTTTMELLAPAGDWEALLAGLAGGADAIYLGGKDFNARQNAANFDLDQIQKAADLLHIHDRKLYITVNTLIAETEIDPALHYLNELWNIGVDAVIIQDPGLIHLAHKYLPELELHASTQMTIHNLEGARYLKRMGISRIVLARELTRDEVAAIAAEPGIEVEVFVHGALCVCYSGQCLMSSMIGGRSGNRGRCAQPCRLSYQLIKDNQALATPGSYLLSTKDLALLTLLPELGASGVKALKIEGRMKRPEYVHTVVETYRRALDRYDADPEKFQVEESELRQLEEAFNRGFSTGYFGGNRNSRIIGLTRPNNRGVYLGRILGFNAGSKLVRLRLEADLEVDDEIEVWISKGGRAALKVTALFDQNQHPINNANAGSEVNLKIPGKIQVGDRVFKVYSSRIDRSTNAALQDGSPVPLVVTFTGQLGEPFRVSWCDPDENQVEIRSENELQQAQNRPLTLTVLREQLGRLGNTPFYLQDLSGVIDANLMLPLSDLNQIRRQAVSALTEKRLAAWRHQPIKLESRNWPEKEFPQKVNGPSEPLLSVWVGDLDGVAAAATAGADLIYAGGDELTGFHWNRSAIEQAVAIAHERQAQLVVGLPRINREGQKEIWQELWEQSLQINCDGIILSDFGSLNLALSSGETPDLYLNYPFNSFNSWSLMALNNPKVRQVTVSPELNLKQLSDLAGRTQGIRLECLVQGQLELMISEYCPVSLLKEPGRCGRDCRKERFYLRDRLNLDFPVVTDQFCRMHLLNSKDLCLYGELEQLSKLPSLTWRMELKTMPASQVEIVVGAYRRALQYLAVGEGVPDAERVIAQLINLTGRGITKGHYFRGVE